MGKTALESHSKSHKYHNSTRRKYNPLGPSVKYLFGERKPPACTVTSSTVLKTKTTEDIDLPEDDQLPLHLQVPLPPHDVAAGMTESGTVPEQGATLKLDIWLQSKETTKADIL